MADEQHIKQFSSADIAAYHQGKLSPAEMHALEKAALEDPFLADALDGYLDHQREMASDLQDLNKRLANRIAEKEDNKVVVLPKKNYSLLKIAAMVILVAGGGLLIYQLNSNNAKNSPLAKEETTVSGNKTLEDSNELVKSKQTIGTTNAIGADTTSTELAKSDLSTSANSSFSQIETQYNFSTADTANLKKSTNQEVATIAPAKEGNHNNVIAEQKQLNANNDKEVLVVNESAPTAMANTRIGDTRRRNAAKAENNYVVPVSPSNNGMVVTDSYNYKYKNNIASFNVFRGKVTDEANNPLPFVNITNTVDNVGTYSDANGNFTMIYPDSILNVNVRSLGYFNKNTRLSNVTTGNQIIMQDDRSTLNEVVISTKKINSKRRDNNMVLEEPEPADGWTNYDTYLANNLNIPETFETKKGSGGEVELSFEVNKQGEPINIKIEKSLCETCDKEAIRALKEGPKWKRKAKKGRTSVTISF